jgi:hypothetical protein
LLLYTGWLMLPNDEEGAEIMVKLGNSLWVNGYRDDDGPFVEFDVEVVGNDLWLLEPHWGVALWGLRPTGFDDFSE